MSRRFAGVLLGGAILWQVAAHSGPSTGWAIVHVSTPDVVVTVDEATYPVESLWTTPVVFELRPGRHTVRMLRADRVLYEEEFSVIPGEETILSAWDGYKDGRSPRRAD